MVADPSGSDENELGQGKRAENTVRSVCAVGQGPHGAGGRPWACCWGRVNARDKTDAGDLRVLRAGVAAGSGLAHSRLLLFFVGFGGSWGARGGLLCRSRGFAVRCRGGWRHARYSGAGGRGVRGEGEVGGMPQAVGTVSEVSEIRRP